MFSAIALALVGGFLIYRSFAYSLPNISHSISNVTETSATVHFALDGGHADVKPTSLDVGWTTLPIQANPQQRAYTTKGKSIPVELTALGCGKNKTQVRIHYTDPQRAKEAKVKSDFEFWTYKIIEVHTTCYYPGIPDSIGNSYGGDIDVKVTPAGNGIVNVKIKTSVDPGLFEQRITHYSFWGQQLPIGVSRIAGQAHGEIQNSSKEISVQYKCVKDFISIQQIRVDWRPALYFSGPPHAYTKENPRVDLACIESGFDPYTGGAPSSSSTPSPTSSTPKASAGNSSTGNTTGSSDRAEGSPSTSTNQTSTPSSTTTDRTSTGSESPNVATNSGTSSSDSGAGTSQTESTSPTSDTRTSSETETAKPSKNIFQRFWGWLTGIFRN